MATEDDWYAQTEKDEWQTPDWLWQGIDEHVTINLDPCAGPDTEIGETNWHIGRGEDGLEEDWFGTVFVNPPFSDKNDWMDKIHQELSNTDLVFLVTPDSTDVQSWWHDGIVPHADYVWFSEGRISYVDPDTGEQAGSPTFGTAVSMFGDTTPELLGWLSEHGWLVEEVTNPYQENGVQFDVEAENQQWAEAYMED